MAWNDIAQLESRLTRALNCFDWSDAAAICSTIAARLRTDPEVFPELAAKRILGQLRRKRRFELMSDLAEALLQSGLRPPPIRRQYAQGLIDRGILAAAEMVLQSIIHDPQGFQGEELEARGLMGRIYKQIYVDNDDRGSLRNRANLERAIGEYLQVYRHDPSQYLWQGINVVALADRARRDGASLSGLPDAAALAGDILATVEERERQSPTPLPAFDIATQLEALVALDRCTDAADVALRYIDAPDADAFELYATLRQLTEVWQLANAGPPCSHLLSILRAGYLAKQGAMAEEDPRHLHGEAAAVASLVSDLERIFGSERTVTLRWYRDGLQQCDAIARIERRNGKGFGTGWLVDAADFFPGRRGVLLLTNAHVLSDRPDPYGIPPGQAQANFQTLGQVIAPRGGVVWGSPAAELDASFVELETAPPAAPLRLHSLPAAMAEPAPRMYIIGHPGGRDLELSLQDNRLLACSEALLHYRTPTEPGSSGSPVFEPDGWRVVALHHRGSDEMARIDGKPGTYQANEGVAILAIQRATRAGERQP